MMLDKKELDEIQADLMRVLELPSDTLEKLITLLENETEINSFNVSDLLNITGSKTESLINLIENNCLDNRSLLVALRASMSARGNASKLIEDFELCWTGPPNLDVHEKSTDSVMQEMLERARENILLVDYRITDKGDTIKKLSDCMEKVNNIDIIIDDDKKNINMSTIDDTFRGIKKPRIFVHKKKEKSYYKVHAKILIVDKKEILITSANLTYYGLSQNFEMGIRIKGEPAKNAYSLIRKMIDSKYFEELK